MRQPSDPARAAPAQPGGGVSARPQDVTAAVRHHTDEPASDIGRFDHGIDFLRNQWRTHQ